MVLAGYSQGTTPGRKEGAETTRPPCPFNITKYKDADACKVWTKKACEPGHVPHEAYAKATKFCKRMCNPNCDPTRVADRIPRGGQVAHIPVATVVPGHRYCKERYTIETQKSDTKNRATGAVVRMPVCAKCMSNKYFLRPAYSSGGQIFGNCELLEKHELWHLANSKCNRKICTDASRDHFNQCVQYGGGWGVHEWDTQWGVDGGKNNHTAGIPGLTGEVPPPANMAVSFTCARTYAVATRASQGLAANNRYWERSINGTYGTGKGAFVITRATYNIVHSTISSCYSAEEDASGEGAPQMECVNHKILKSCHVTRLQKKQDELPTHWWVYTFDKEEAAARKDLETKVFVGIISILDDNLCMQTEMEVQQEEMMLSTLSKAELTKRQHTGWKVCTPLESRMMASMT